MRALWITPVFTALLLTGCGDLPSVQGLANKEIAAKLDISESAVKNTMQQLFTKSGVRNRSQLVRVALEHHRNLL